MGGKKEGGSPAIGCVKHTVSLVRLRRTEKELNRFIFIKMIGRLWNVRGIGQHVKKGFVIDLILERKLDFIGLQETIKTDYTKNKLRNLCGGRNLFGTGLLLKVYQEEFWWGLTVTLVVTQVEIGVYFVRILVFDKIAKFHWNLITVHGDAWLDGIADFLKGLS